MQKNKNRNIDFMKFLVYFENVFIIDKQLAIHQNKLSQFKSNMKRLFDIF